ncbi:prolipoprotein diacylglyceryl transferase, partial [Candidatus Berkelbacteria bacterium]|nr:prolipoprotein diacylglyceryl transferase [Candidatus Berkelbacteria bacterium]
MTWHPPEILFALDSVSVHTYGVVLAIAIGVAFLWGERRAVARGLPKHLASDIFFWAVLGALVGARLGFVMQEFGYFSAHPPEILAFWQGGLSFHGGLVGGLIAGLIVLKKRHAMTQFWLLADAAAAPLLLGAAIGRLGNWANQELYGYPTDVPWAITIDAAHRLPGYEAFATFHPTFAYEIILNLTGLLILLFLLEKKKPLQATSYKLQAGKTFLFFLAWYSLARGLT